MNMNEKHNDATRNRPAGERVLDAPMVHVDLPAFIRQIREEETWSKYDRNSITVFKTADMRVVLGGLHAGAGMIPHKAEGMMSIQVLEGELKVNTGDMKTSVKAGQMVVVHKDEMYSITANEESIYLLTMSEVGRADGISSSLH
jgi:quercetin dioxygenase-like cupin family protein